MSATEIITALGQKRAALNARGVQHLAVFGSQARGNASPGSDLDVLVDIDPSMPKFSLVDLAAVSNLIADITGLETVAIERRMLARNPAFAARIADDIIEVF
ncbi:MAG: nucleotidyltransferase domain-containing protein [Hyphomicrobiales bacterium]|nr:nucleotidyltransferase domain-containing protein [Hyphomicrobiales bacterium]